MQSNPQTTRCHVSSLLTTAILQNLARLRSILQYIARFLKEIAIQRSKMQESCNLTVHLARVFKITHHFAIFEILKRSCKTAVNLSTLLRDKRHLRDVSI